MDLVKIMEVGEKLGLSGSELKEFVKEGQSRVREDQNRARDDRAKQLELRKQEKENAEIQLAIEREKRAISEQLNSSTQTFDRQKARTPKLPAFNEDKDDLDAYLQRFERYATSHNWPNTEWAINLSALLTGKALEVYSRLPNETANDYEELKKSLLKRFQLTADGFRTKFLTGRPEAGETGHQYAARMKHYLNRWIKLANIKTTYDDLVDLLLRSQYLDGCQRELALFLKERQPATLKDTIEITDKYLEARGGTFKGTPSPRHNPSRVLPPDTRKSAGESPNFFSNPSPTNQYPRQCYVCHRQGHLAKDCPKSVNSKPNPRTCFLCHKPGHFARDCWSNTRKAAGLVTPQDFQYADEEYQPVDNSFESPEGNYVSNEPHFEYSIDNSQKIEASCMVVRMPPTAPQEYCMKDTKDHVMLGCGHSLPLMSAACSENFVRQMPVTVGLVGSERASVLRDSGCSGAVVRQGLVTSDQMTGKESTCVLIDGTVRKVPLAIIHVDTPYFTGNVEALCMQKPLYDLILGNLDGVRAPNEPDTTWKMPTRPTCAVQTRSQEKKQAKPFRSLKVPKPMEEIVTPEDLKRAQQEDETLQKTRDLAHTQTEKVSRHNGVSSFYYQDDILHRTFHSPNVESDHIFTQVVVPKPYRRQVMRIAHETLLGGHQGAKKTIDKVLTNFFWPGINADITRYCRSCDVCQRTLPKGKITKVPLGKMPLIETPFERIAVDIVGPIHPLTDRKNRYILTIIDYATRYPEAIPLPGIEAERVAEALMSVFTRVGIPKEMLTDQGSQFTSEIMRQVSTLLSMKQLTTTPYHPAANGLVEKFNGTLKQMLKRMCAERPTDWDRYIEPLLFAIRESPQESLGFSPFELLYGRTVRGPMTILRELWTGEVQTGETKTTYQYILDLRNRLEETCQNAHTELQKASTRYKTYYDKKAKPRQFEVGDKVLLLLPTDRNKLLLQWKGPFPVISKISAMDYRIDLNGKPKVFHANLLKKYYEREISCLVSDPFLDIACTAVIEADDEDDETSSESQPTMTNPSLLQPYPLQAKESLADVDITPELTPPQKIQIQELLQEYEDILTDIPGRTVLGQHDIKLKETELPKGKPYPIPHALRDTVKDEVKTMLSLDVIEPSNSPFASPIVLVKKPDGSNRFCVDFRRLNRVTTFDAEPIPDQDELFTKIANSHFFTKLDLSKGYWQIPMSPKSKPLTAFITPDGLFQFKVMPFGLVNAPAAFSRIMRSLLQDLEGVVNYIDDILVHSATWEQHLHTLTELFKRLRAANLTARPSKCFVGHQQVEFLGHVVGRGHIAPRPEKVKAIQEVKQPHTKKQLRSFLGMANYYRKFIPNYSAIAAPLTDKTKKNEPNKVIWETSQERAFNALKSKLANPPILHLPDLNRNFVLRTDASDIGVGAVLLQMHDEEKFPVAYASRKLLPREKAYSTIEKECLAIVWAVRKFEPYLYGRAFVLETDHQPLTYMQTAKVANGRIMRWALALQPYRFRIEAIKGSENVGADLLSRL